MKMKPHKFYELETAINRILKENPGVTYQYSVGAFPRSESVKDLQKRFCFDLLYAANTMGYLRLDSVYDGLNDSHMYTALKQVCPIITRKY